MKQKVTKKESGITLIALVVTIVILLILAGITINYVFNEGGLFDTAKNSGNTWHEAENSDINAIKEVNGIIENSVNSSGNSGTTTPTESDAPTSPEEQKGPNNKPLVTNGSLKIIDTAKNREVEDINGNKVIIPKGFKIVEDSGATVPEGIVIEDGASTEATGTEGTEGYIPATTGNQFVWIPVGTVYMDEARTAEKAKQVQLGRYTFDSSGTPNPVQLAFKEDETANYANQNGTMGLIKEKVYSISELSISREGTINTSNRNNDLNATAENLGIFLEKTRDNGGYYIARFEASYGSGYNPDGTDDIEKYGNAKPLSKVSTANASSMNYKEGTLWNNITQLNASRVARNMYNNDSAVGIESDLMNSYAFDTAIVYISQMKEEYANFANFKYNTAYGTDKNIGNKKENNTGTNEGDKFCNLFDMVANYVEWTTEYSTYKFGGYARPCVYRGDNHRLSNYTAYRSGGSIITESSDVISFRPICYIK